MELTQAQTRDYVKRQMMIALDGLLEAVDSAFLETASRDEAMKLLSDVEGEEGISGMFDFYSAAMYLGVWVKSDE